MNDASSERYNRLYTETYHPFGQEPTFLVKEVVRYLQSGEALDIGAGDGRDSVYLAAQGFHVLAIDSSDVAVKKIKEVSHRQDIFLDTEVADIRTRRITHSYELILAVFMLHHLLRSEALRILKDIMMHTNVRGINIIATFTKEGDFYEKDRETGNFYMRSNELKALYSKWEVLHYEEREEKAFAKRPDGSPMRNICAYILARKNHYG